MVEVEKEVLNMFTLMLDEGKDEFETSVRDGEPGPNGAYYENIERKILLA